MMDIALALSLAAAAAFLSALVYLMYRAARGGEWQEFSQKTRAEMYDKEKRAK
jgi:hypothetical protein